MLNMFTPTKHTRIKATELHRDQNYSQSLSDNYQPTFSATAHWHQHTVSLCLAMHGCTCCGGRQKPLFSAANRMNAPNGCKKKQKKNGMNQKLYGVQ